MFAGTDEEKDAGPIMFTLKFKSLESNFKANTL